MLTAIAGVTDDAVLCPFTMNRDASSTPKRGLQLNSMPGAKPKASLLPGLEHDARRVRAAGWIEGVVARDARARAMPIGEIEREHPALGHAVLTREIREQRAPGLARPRKPASVP